MVCCNQASEGVGTLIYDLIVLHVFCLLALLIFCCCWAHVASIYASSSHVCVSKSRSRIWLVFSLFGGVVSPVRAVICSCHCAIISSSPSCEHVCCGCMRLFLLSDLCLGYLFCVFCFCQCVFCVCCMQCSCVSLFLQRDFTVGIRWCVALVVLARIPYPVRLDEVFRRLVFSVPLFPFFV